MNQQQPQDNAQQFHRAMIWLALVARALAASVEVYLHQTSTFGVRYFGLQTAAAALILLVYPLFCEGPGVEALLGFLLAYLLMCAAARVASAVQRLRGRTHEHSYYTGRPRIMRLVGRMSETTVKGVVEPALVFLGSVVTSHYSEPLGGYLMLAAAGLFISVQMALAADRRRALDMNDALIDQRRIVEQWRTMRRD